jgi:hypothetical protein
VQNGRKVEAYWTPDKSYYPAVVTVITADGLFSVKFEDGLTANLKGDKMKCYDEPVPLVPVSSQQPQSSDTPNTAFDSPSDQVLAKE